MHWEHDSDKEPNVLALSDRIIGNPGLVRELADELRSYLSPNLPTLDDLLKDEEAAWQWADGHGAEGLDEDTLPEHYYALTSLVNALATKAIWWKKHNMTDAEPGPYPHGQARHLSHAVDWIKIGGGVELPEHLASLSMLKKMPGAPDPQA